MMCSEIGACACVMRNGQLYTATMNDDFTFNQINYNKNCIKMAKKTDFIFFQLSSWTLIKISCYFNRYTYQPAIID